MLEIRLRKIEVFNIYHKTYVHLYSTVNVWSQFSEFCKYSSSIYWISVPTIWQSVLNSQFITRSEATCTILQIQRSMSYIPCEGQRSRPSVNQKEQKNREIVNVPAWLPIWWSVRDTIEVPRGRVEESIVRGIRPRPTFPFPEDRGYPLAVHPHNGKDHLLRRWFTSWIE